MDTRPILITLLMLGVFIAVLIGSTSADGNTSPSGMNLSLNSTNNTINGTVNVSSNLETNLSRSVDSNETMEKTEADSTGSTQNIQGNIQGMYSGTENPNEPTDVQSSTPSGDPLLNQYALGGVSIDIGAHLMEARGNDTNVSAEISLKDHTSANGYIKTIQKDFHYESKVDTPENADTWPNL
ncbi:hypothetical protein [Methanospirillum lacunae]|uniref:Uncharacterized protein n=1 Tax=Methanospirillum lacunae TaxID=668570 RepID=A0A2V2N210_9EURY|nr:hypothetical protein [Methanospirillum lacunae]PWR73789.1 hypothetical protein DK846_01065 [Methanospirillum lacunae]